MNSTMLLVSSYVRRVSKSNKKRNSIGLQNRRDGG